MSLENVFITGASGKIGHFLVEELKKKNYRLSMLCLETERVRTDPGIRIVRGDLLKPGTYAPFLNGVDTVVHMAAVTHTNDTELYFKVNDEGTRDLVKACEENGVKRFIYISTRAISTFGGSYSLSKLAGERHIKESKMDWVILRPAEVYGASGKEGVDMLIDKVHTFPFVPIVGDGKYTVAPVHILDVISSIVSAVERTGIKGKTYTLAGPENFEYNAFVEKLLNMKGVNKVKIHIPLSLCHIAARTVVFLKRGRGFAMDQLPRLLSDKSADISLAAEDLSYNPRGIGSVCNKGGKNSEFDKFSPNYTRILNCDVRLSGENSEYFASYKAERVKRFLGDGFKGRILDYGCGVGLVSDSLRKNFDPRSVEIAGYDISAESIKEAERKVSAVKFTDDIGRVKSELFDVIIMANVLHHIDPGQRRIFLKETAGLLKRGGFIFIFEHNPYNPLTRLTVKFSVLDKNTSLLRSSESSRLLREAGMEIQQRKYIVFFPKVLKIFRPLEPFLGCVPMGAQYMCAGRLGERKC